MFSSKFLADMKLEGWSYLNRLQGPSCNYTKMGQTLSEPVTTKESARCQNTSFLVGSSCMQGWRVNMEDAHTHILSLPDDPQASFFAVYDGHGGSKVADYAGKHLHKHITQRAEYKDGNIAEALRRGFLEFDEILFSEEYFSRDSAGSTAVTILVKDGCLYCANIGDSRAIASVNGYLEVLSFDHKPSNPMEMQRIMHAGGWVDCNRVNGNLALSRAFGDFVFKRNGKKTPEEQVVIAYPDLEARAITPEWEFIVLACDGIWDVLSNEDVIDFVRTHIARGVEPKDICEQLMMRCLAPDCHMAGLGCDNMTVVIVAMLHGKPYEDLSRRCSSIRPIHLSIENMLRKTRDEGLKTLLKHREAAAIKEKDKEKDKDKDASNI